MNLQKDLNIYLIDKAVRVLLLDGCASDDSRAGFGYFTSAWVRSTSGALVGFFTTVKLD